MKYIGHYSSPFFVYCKKHFCPQCGTELGRIRVSKVVNSKSPEAKDFDFHHVDCYLSGNVKFTWTEFKCPQCEFQIKINDLIKYERNQRKSAN